MEPLPLVLILLVKVCLAVVCRLAPPEGSQTDIGVNQSARGDHMEGSRHTQLQIEGSELHSSLQAKAQNTFILFSEGVSHTLYSFLLPIPSQCSMEPLPFGSNSTG